MARTCHAVQTSDQMTCRCGNVWDMNDLDPPACGEAALRRPSERWDGFFRRMATEVASLSKDPDRQVGAVLVSPDRRQLSIGFNGFPPELEDLPSRLADKEFKLAHMVHAEDNCLRQSPFNPRGCAMYVTAFPCRPCAELLVAAGVARLVALEPDLGHWRWGRSWTEALGLLANAGVEVVTHGP